MMKRAIIYSRFSPRRDADTSDACEKQEQLCREHCERQGYSIAGTFRDEAMSGSDAERPGLWDAVEMLARGDLLVVYSVDRLARDVMLHHIIEEQVRKAGAVIEYVAGGGNGDSPQDKLVRQILAALAEYQRQVTRARTRVQMARHQRAGRRMSKLPPYGFKIDPQDDSRLVEDEDEQAVIERVMELHRQGHAYSAIARELEASNIEPRGSRWYHETVRRIVQRATNHAS